MKTPKEDPADRAARLSERRLSELEQVRAGQANAAAMTSDLRAVYGFRNSFGYRMPPSVFRPTGATPSYAPILKGGPK